MASMKKVVFIENADVTAGFPKNSKAKLATDTSVRLERSGDDCYLTIQQSKNGGRTYWTHAQIPIATLRQAIDDIS